MAEKARCLEAILALDGYKLTTARNSPLRIYQDSVDKLLKRRQQPN